jgi:hypothetical protein
MAVMSWKKGMVWNEVMGWIIILSVVLIIIVVIAKASGKLDVSILRGVG